MLVFEPGLLPPRSPLIDPALQAWMPSATDEIGLDRLARESTSGARLSRHASYLELRCPSGFRVVVSDGTAGCSWHRS